MSDYKIITYLDSSMKIHRGKRVPFQEYERLTRASILRLLKWLNEHVLDNQEFGFNLRSKISEGIRFDQEWHQYLIESYCYWSEQGCQRRGSILANTSLKVTPTRMINQSFIPQDSDDETVSPDLRSATPTPRQPSPNPPFIREFHGKKMIH